MNGLTVRQSEILAYIRGCIRADGMPPTRKEIASHFGFRSANSAEEHLCALRDKGAIQLIPAISRGIRLLDGAM